jgi:hypothetical protein
VVFCVCVCVCVQMKVALVGVKWAPYSFSNIGMIQCKNLNFSDIGACFRNVKFYKIIEIICGNRFKYIL